MPCFHFSYKFWLCELVNVVWDFLLGLISFALALDNELKELSVDVLVITLLTMGLLVSYWSLSTVKVIYYFFGDTFWFVIVSQYRVF